LPCFAVSRTTLESYLRPDRNDFSESESEPDPQN
jgi:hypothetical protein